MIETSHDASWTIANQSYLVGEFARLKRLLGDSAEAELAVTAARVPAELDPPPTIERLVELFGLSTFERETLLLCAGVEMDSQLAALCGEAQGQPQRAFVTFGLALAALPDPHWSALAPARPLRRFRLVSVEGGRGLTTAPIRIDERILHYLGGVNLLDPRLQSFLQACPAPEWIAAGQRAVAQQAVRAGDAHPSDPPVLQFCGDDPNGQEDVAALVAWMRGQQLFVLHAEDLPALGPDLDELAQLWERERLLVPGALCLHCPPGGLTSSARHLAERLPGPLFLACREPLRLSRPFLRFDLDKPEAHEQKQLWQQAVGSAATDLNGSLDALSEQFRLSARAIFTTGAQVTSDGGPVDPKDLWNACRSLARPRLEDLAQRIVPLAAWEDLVLPHLQMQTLQQLADQVRHRLKVYETWGFAEKERRGLGVSALFAGASGTGKTMAAEVLARDLELDLYRIDLSAVVSKYIGETEKNLKQVFDAAEEGGVLLLFDEADALFGKRGEVRDSHDRYANIEVGYLLQRMEAYRGLAVLTTNLKSTMDKAFQRRLRFTVSFPFPDAAQRAAIWERVFPPRTPTDGLDPARLAQLNMTGGNIRNIALNAAFLAAAEETSIGMEHILQAAQLEAEKMERPLAEAEIRGWV